MTPEEAAALRKPFPASAVGKLPRGNVMLDYVGHAATTDRLLSVDPAWTWEPYAVDADGLPVVKHGCLWIRLTVCGVTRPGVGDGNSLKEMIGDALRNAAMRFGVALDLWSKEELEHGAASRPAKTAEPEPEPAPSREPEQHDQDPHVTAYAAYGPAPVTPAQLKKLGALMKEAGIVTRDNALLYVGDVIGREVSSRNELTRGEASAVIDAIQHDLHPEPPPEVTS